MNMEKFEELDDQIMEIVARTGVVSSEWIAQELNIDKTEAHEALEVLVTRGDLRGRNWSGWYTLRYNM